MILGLTPQQQENIEYRPKQPLSRLVKKSLTDRDFESVEADSDLLPEEKLYIAWGIIINGANAYLSEAAKLPTNGKIPNFSTLFITAMGLWKEGSNTFEKQVLDYFYQHCGDGVFDEKALRECGDPLEVATQAGVKTAELMTKKAITYTIKNRDDEPSQSNVKQLVTRLAHNHLILNTGVAGFTKRDGKLVIGMNDGLHSDELETSAPPFKDQEGILAKKKLGCPVIHSGVAPQLLQTQIQVKATRAIACAKMLPNTEAVVSRLELINN